MHTKSWSFVLCVCVALANGNDSWAMAPLKTVRMAVSSIAERSEHETSKSLEREVLDSIAAQLPNLKLEPAAETILQYIVETRKVPADAKFSVLANDILCLDICLTEAPQTKSGYRLLLRHPALKSRDDGSLFLDEKWAPRENELWTWNGNSWKASKK